MRILTLLLWLSFRPTATERQRCVSVAPFLLCIFRSHRSDKTEEARISAFHFTALHQLSSTTFNNRTRNREERDECRNEEIRGVGTCCERVPDRRMWRSIPVDQGNPTRKMSRLRKEATHFEKGFNVQWRSSIGGGHVPLCICYRIQNIMWASTKGPCSSSLKPVYFHLK
jgi:hypothetical protein